MAFQVFWKIKFKSLRAGTDYCVNIYKDGTLPSGYPLTLKGGANPFTTEEDSDDDMFTPIRTQSGYIRIVDDGLAETAGGVSTSWNWKDLLPATDTDRPVVLQKKVGSSWVTVWQGFMQAQTFGGTLYGNPQEREFPVQCPLTVTHGTDINYAHTSIENFAYLLKQIVDSIPSVSRPTDFVIQGGTDAQAWLMKRIDWQNFVSEDGDDNTVARFSMYQCLEDMCRFWGWTARTCGSTMYLTCADDAAETTFLTLTTAQLATLAAGTTAGSTSATFNTASLTGDIFANTSQNDYLQRGHNKAVVTADISASDGELVNVLPDKIVEEWAKNGFYGDDYINHIYTSDHDSFGNSFMQGNCNSGATFNVEKLPAIGAKNSESVFSVIRIKSQYNENNILASFETKYWHCFADGVIQLRGNIYRKGEKITENDGDNEWGKYKMYICFGIGTSRNTAKWFDGYEWSSTKKKFIARICGNDGVLWCQDIYNNDFGYRLMSSYIPTDNIYGILGPDLLFGKIFIDIYGSDDFTYNSTNETMDIADFNVAFKRRSPLVVFGYNTKRNSSCKYTASNQNNVRDEFNTDCIYGSENNSNFGFGVVLNNFYEYMQKISYNGSEIPEYPEQHLANRVVNYWQTSKRRLAVDVRTNTIADITPQYKVTINGTTGYPIAITRDYWNDITTLTILEL